MPSDTEYEPSFAGQRYKSSNVNVGASDSELMGYIFGQFLLHEGLKKFGARGENTALGKMS